MLESKDLIAQVSRNCTLSDARHAGGYSVCGLALRLRDLYKWEKGQPPWKEDDPKQVLEWIGKKEDRWEAVEKQEFNPLFIKGQHFDPFDSGEINNVLSSQGLYYGAGYARSLKPTFFLAVLEKTMEINGYPVHILGRELSRDLSTLPALSQNSQIIIRKDAGKYYFWDQLFFIKNSGKKALEFALNSHGLTLQDTHKLQKNLAHLFEIQIDTFIHHELGEIRDRAFDAKKWRAIIAAFAGTPVEILARAVKDLSADTGQHGLLRHVIARGRVASLAFYAAFIDGLLRELFPEIRAALNEFTKHRDWATISRAVQSGQDKARRHADTMSRIFDEGTSKNDLKWAENEIKRRLLVPLGVKK